MNHGVGQGLSDLGPRETLIPIVLRRLSLSYCHEVFLAVSKEFRVMVGVGHDESNNDAYADGDRTCRRQNTPVCRDIVTTDLRRYISTASPPVRASR